VVVLDSQQWTIKKRPQSQSHGDNYRLIARKLRKLALECRSPRARQEILDLAARCKPRGDHFDLHAADWDPTTFGRDAAVKAYQVTLRDRETQTVVGYYNGAWTTDQRRALTTRKREAAEARAALMRDRCPRNAELITVEEIRADDW
jgi:hypothetical protein